MESKVSSGGNQLKNGNLNRSLLSNVDLKLLRVFKCVVETGGFTSASNQLGLGLASISKQISDLEVRLGVSLCSRGREGFSLTEQGEIVYDACLELFSAIGDFQEKLYSTRTEIIGDIDIGIIDNVISDPKLKISKAIRYMCHQAPKVNVTLHTASLNELEKGLFDNRFHCIIAPAYEYKDDLNYNLLYKEESLLYCGAKHALFNTEDQKITFKDINDENLINHTYALRHKAKKDLGLDSCPTKATQVEAVALLIMTGLFLGFLPKHYAYGKETLGEFRAIKPEQFKFDTDICMITKNDKSSKILKLFAEGLKENSVASN